jgi:tetratricopeptide (TPR) repeat protein
VSSEALYEQYKDALKRGHVASLRGRVDAALLAYAEAARIAPERSTPHTSAGTALLRRKRPGEAILHYEVALSISPRDETALLGRAQSLTALDRRGEAANAFDTLAELQAGSGRLADAVDAARRALELAEGRERRKTLERLIARLRAARPDEPGRLALERALLVLEGPAVAPPKKGKPAVSVQSAEQAESMAIAEAVDAEPVSAGIDEPAEHVDIAAAAGEGIADAGAVELAAEAIPSEPAVVETAQSDLAGEKPPIGPSGEAAASELVGEAVPSEAAGEAGPGERPSEAVPSEAPVEAAPAPAPTGPMRRPIPEGVTAADLVARAQTATDAGAAADAVEALLDLAALHAREWRTDAALDACYAALTFDPDSVELHLAMVELYSGRGWSSLAGEKLDLLERLARLDEDDAAVAEISSVRARA